MVLLSFSLVFQVSFGLVMQFTFVLVTTISPENTAAPALKRCELPQHTFIIITTVKRWTTTLLCWNWMVKPSCGKVSAWCVCQHAESIMRPGRDARLLATDTWANQVQFHYVYAKLNCPLSAMPSAFARWTLSPRKYSFCPRPVSVQEVCKNFLLFS